MIFSVLVYAPTGCHNNSAALPCRFSSDLTECYIYLAKNIAIHETTSTNVSKVTTHFAIVKAHWLNAPELANTTGDVTDENIVSTPDRVGTDERGKWLVIEKQSDLIGAKSGAWAIFLPTEKVYSAENLAALEQQFKTNHVDFPRFRLEPMEDFFEERLTKHFNPKGPLPNW